MMGAGGVNSVLILDRVRPNLCRVERDVMKKEVFEKGGQRS